MNRLVRQLAKRSSVSPGQAADQLDKVVHSILLKLRRGETAPLPGIGVLTPGPATQLIEDLNGNDAAARTRR